MKKFKIQSFLQKNFLKKNILNKMFSKFFTFFNMPKGTRKIGFNQLKKKNIENYISEKFQLNYALFVLSIVFFLFLLSRMRMRLRLRARAGARAALEFMVGTYCVAPLNNAC